MRISLWWIVACLLWLGLSPAAGAGVVTLDRAEAAAEVQAAGLAAWKPVVLPNAWEHDFPGHSGYVQYRIPFEPPQEDGLAGVYIQRACTNVEVYLNGELIGSGGLMREPVTRNCYYPQLFQLPRALLRPQGNELRVRVAGFAAREVSARQRAAGLSEIKVGSMRDLQPLYDRQLFWNVTVAQIIAATIAVLGASMLGLAAMRRKDTYLLFFGLFSTGWALISARLFVQDVPIGHMATEILICSAFPPVLGCAYLFLLRFVERRWRRVDRLLVAQAVLVPFALWAAGSQHLLTVASSVYNLLAVEFLVTVAVFSVVAWRGYRREFWLMSLVLVLAVALTAIEIALQNDLLPLPKIHVIHFAMPLLFGVIGVRLIQLFVGALNRAETANQQLEERVAEKSIEIERSYAQLSELREQHAAQAERQRIASDLHDDLGAKLLTIAQATDSERVAGMARQALDEMRLSVRGLTASPSPAEDVVADWRAEQVSRLEAAGIVPHWEAGAPASGLALPARTHVQLTRVLRETVSNTIRHSGARNCRVRIDFEPNAMTLEVEDDGRGLGPGAMAGQGHGLPGIERRVRKLGGMYILGRGGLGGALLRVVVPLEAPATENPAPDTSIR